MQIHSSLAILALGAFLAACASSPSDTREVSLDEATEITGRSAGPDILYTTRAVRLYSFTLTERQRIKLYSVSFDSIWTPDLIAELMNSEGQVIAQDDNSGPVRNFGFNRTLDPGKYYVKVWLKRSPIPFSRDRMRLNGDGTSTDIPDYLIILDRYPPEP